MDFCLFHVEHSYLTLFTEYAHALKQRNALLKSRSNLSELDYWDAFLAVRCNAISKYRIEIIQMINHILSSYFSESFLNNPVEIIYQPGWNTELMFLDVLKKNRSRDIKYGFTRYGVHRDELKYISNGFDIQRIFSRGQIKKTSIFLILSQLILLNEKVSKKSILLIDDITSELDNVSTDYVLRKLSNMNLQLFITNINFNKNLLRHHEEFKLFHVEHGMIKAVKNNRESNV